MENGPILVVDDDPSLRRAIAEVLTRGGHRVAVAANGVEGLEKLRATRPSMVISDLKMPVLDGLEFLRRARVESPETPMMVMTAYGRVDDAVEAMKAGALDFITKPFAIEHLEGLVKRAFQQGAEEVAPQEKADSGVIARDAKMLQVLKIARGIASSRATVLLQGESGTGKEVVAHYIHEHGRRSSGPFIAVNCAALPENLLESELFGHEKGAFSGAVSAKPGKFEMADGGTLLLDEISEMHQALQAKLLRVLQEREVDRVGGRAAIPVDIRVIATTNRDMRRMVAAGEFREDLYYRLNVFPLKLPPLRERQEDIPPLAQHFLRQHAAANEKPLRAISDAAMARLCDYPWPGNVRELNNTLERAVLIAEGSQLLPEDLLFEEAEFPPSPRAGEEPGLPVGTTLRTMEKRLILRTLGEMRGNRTLTAKVLGISLRTLRNKLREYRTEGEYVPAPGGEE